MVLEVTLVPGYAGYILPSYLQGRLRFSLNVNVTPVNDPPVLEIPSAKVLRLAQVSCENKLPFLSTNTIIDFALTLFALNRVSKFPQAFYCHVFKSYLMKDFFIFFQLISLYYSSFAAFLLFNQLLILNQIIIIFQK